MIGRVVLITFLVGLSLQQCTIGCLKCNNLNQCVLCDITNQYYSVGGTCAKSTLTNCKLISLLGACVQCDANFYLDNNAQRCTAVTATNVITNCAAYGTTGFCASCTGNFILNNAQCVAVNVTIANCAAYSANGVCSMCATGFQLSNDFASCVSINSNANCMYYSYIGCMKCKTGFINNPNFYFTNFNTISYLYSMYLTPTVLGINNWIQLAQCQPIVVTNCVAWSAFDTCSQCAAGYFLSGKVCVAFPITTINSCITYSSLITCIGCAEGYFLSTNTCVLNTVIANCLTYLGTAAATTCVLCNTGFYVQGNICTARVNSASITNCQTVSPNADTCATCVTGFILTTDARACRAALANCATYAASTVQTSALLCSLCSSGFYTTSSGSTSVCTAGSVANCDIYQINANACTKCINGYYLASSSSCVNHVTIDNCVTYDPTKQNFCATCASGYFNFAYTTVCVQVSQKTNCVAYNFEGTVCTVCATGFYLNSGACASIPSTYANCGTYSGSQCTLCLTGYMVNTLPTVGTCTLPLDYILAASVSPCSIQATVTTGLTPYWVGSPSASQFVLTCATCNDYMYGYSPQQAEAICVNTNQLTLYSGYSAVTNCLRYGISYATAKPIVCMQCASGYFISGYATLMEGTLATTCTSSCTLLTTNSPAVIPDDELGFVNICIPWSTGNANNIEPVTAGICARYGRYTLQKFTGTNTAITDYLCFIPTFYTTIPPTNFMTYSIAAGIEVPYVFESPSATATVGVSLYYGVGYNMIMDQASLTPQVFNWHGLLASPYYLSVGTNANLILPATAALSIATNVAQSTLTNCDIWATHVPATAGTAFDATQTLFTAAATAFVYSCLRCNFGYQLSFTNGGVTASNKAAPSCVQMTTCASATTVYGGLTQFLNSILSCHVCSQGSGAPLYPTIWIETAADTTNAAKGGGWIGFQVANQYSGTAGATTLTSATRHGFKCATAASAITITDTATTSTISNCAVYGNLRPLTVVSLAGAATTGASYFDVCLACAANYWPSYLAAFSATSGAGTSITTTNKLPPWVVTACTPSLNCDTSVVTQFNSCGRCRTDLEDASTPQYYAFHDLTLSNCFRSASRNCFSLESSSFGASSTTNACEICKAGNFLNADTVCEQFKVPNQAISNSAFVNAYVASKVYPAGTQTAPTAANGSRYSRIHYLLSYKQLQYGVTACSSGYSMLPINTWAPRLCVWSSYVYNYTGSFPSGSSFVNNCVRYNLTQVNSKNVCNGCTTGFLPTQDGLSCVTTIANCQMAQTGASTALCYQCLPNFFNINGACVATTIASCSTYLNTRWSFTTPSVLTCSKCQNTFSLSADGLTCNPGRINNCIQYTQGSLTQCTDCSTSYVLLTLANNIYYCYPFPSSLNCALLQDTSGTSGANFGTISCAQCNQGSNLVYGGRQWTALGLTNQAQTLCMPFTTISNCVTYNQNNPIINSVTFACSLCAGGFYYSATNQACVARTNNPGSCLTYSTTADVCTVCSTGTFLSTDGTNCVSFPNGIFQCARYSSAVNCTQCNIGYYLYTNLCLQSTVIPNCALYTANNTCSNCGNSYFLQNSTSCVQATAQNCLTYQSITACSTCNTGFGLTTTNSITNCVLINLNNCINPTTTTPFTCLTCNTGFYPNSNGVCTAVSQTIANCITYDTPTTCTNCTAGTILNVARTVCNGTFYSTFLDPNCQSSILLTQPNCVQCSAGSIFVNGTCSQCTQNVYGSGCLSCDPTNQTSCLVCAPNYYMNNLGACIANNPTPQPNPTNPVVPNGTASLTKAVAVSLFAVAVYFDMA